MNLSENSVWKTILHVHQSQMQSFHLSWSNHKHKSSKALFLCFHPAVSISAQPPVSWLWVESAADRKHFARQAAPNYELLLAGIYVSNFNFYPQQATSFDISVFPHFLFAVSPDWNFSRIYLRYKAIHNQTGRVQSKSNSATGKQSNTAGLCSKLRTWRNLSQIT